MYIYSYLSHSYLIFAHIYPEFHWFVKGFSIDCVWEGAPFH